MNLLLMDLRYAWRAAMRSPVVTLAIIAMLALGTGGVTVVFNPLYSLLFAPLPYPQPEQLALIGGNIPLFNQLSQRFEHEELDRFFTNLTTYAPFHETNVIIPGTGKTIKVTRVEVSEDFFKTLGVLPLRGSDFNRGKMPQAVVVSNRFWRNELMGADDAVGKIILLERIGMMPFQIAGIMPESFDFPAGADIWMYDVLNGAPFSDARQYLGRLRPGMSIRHAAEELGKIEFKPEFALVGKDGPLLQSLQKILYGDRRPILLMLGSTAVLFLVLVCAGVMNLLITQGARRESEMAMRLIFGASRRNLIFQLLRETLPLVVIGGLAGLWISETANAWLMARFPSLKGSEVAVPVKMAFFAAMVLAVTVIAGLTPALYAAGVDLNKYLKAGADSMRRVFSFSMRELLTGLQLGLTLALLTGVGLLVSSMMFHVDIPIRLSSRDVAVVKAEFPRTQNSLSPEDVAVRALFFQEFQHRLSTMPEAAAAGVFAPIPLSASALNSWQMGTTIVYNTFYQDPGSIYTKIIEGCATAEGFEMLGIRLAAGRFFTPDEMADDIDFRIRSEEALRKTRRYFSKVVGGVVIINQSLARQFWPGENAIGKMIYNNMNNAYEVVGVVQDFHQIVDNRDSVAAVYYPSHRTRREQTFIVKLHSEALMKDFRQRLSDFDSGAAVIEVQSLWNITSKATADTRMTLQLLGSFALLGIVVAGLGVYATTSLMATEWNREIGIRMAIGAQVWDILRLALWRGTRAILLGLPFGLFLAWILSRTLASYLFQIKINDPLVWLICCALLLVITIFAALIPAVRASRLNPLDALRNK